MNGNGIMLGYMGCIGVCEGMWRYNMWILAAHSALLLY